MNEMIIVEMQCPFCGKTHSVEVDMDGFFAWQDGELVQNAFPEMSATQREQLISHICPTCQTAIFDSDEDEGDDILACEMESIGGNWW